MKSSDAASSIVEARISLLEQADTPHSAHSSYVEPKVLSRHVYMHNGRRDACRVYVEEENGCAVLRDLVERRDPLDFSQADSKGQTLFHHMMLCPAKDIALNVSLLELILRRLRDCNRYPGDIKPPRQKNDDKKSMGWFLYPIQSKGLPGPLEGENVITLSIRRPALWEGMRRLIPLGNRVQCLCECYRKRCSMAGDSKDDGIDEKELALAAGISLEIFQQLQNITTSESEYFHSLVIPYTPEQARRIDDAILLALTPIEQQRRELLALYEGVRYHLKLYARATARPELVARTLPDFEYILSAIKQTMEPTNTSNIQTRRRQKNLQYRLLRTEGGKPNLISSREAVSSLPFILHSLQDALSGSDSRLLFQWYWRAKRYSIATWTEAHLQFRQDPADALQRWSYVVQSILLDHLQEATRLRSPSCTSPGSDSSSSSDRGDSAPLSRPLLGFSITGSSIAEQDYTGGIILGGLEPLTPAGDFLYLSPTLFESLLQDYPYCTDSSASERISSAIAKLIVNEALSGHRQLWFHLRREERASSENADDSGPLPPEEQKMLTSTYLQIFDRNDRLPFTHPVASIPLPAPDLIFSLASQKDMVSNGPALMVLVIPKDDVARTTSIKSLHRAENNRVVLLFSSQYARWSLPVVGKTQRKSQHEEVYYSSTEEKTSEPETEKQNLCRVKSAINKEVNCPTEDSQNSDTQRSERKSLRQVHPPLSFPAFKMRATSDGKLRLRKTQGYVIRAHLQTFSPPYSGECRTSDLTAVEVFQAVGPAAEDLLSFISKSLYLPSPIRGKVWKLCRPAPLIELDDEASEDDWL